MKVGVMCGEKWYRFASWRRYPLFRIFFHLTASGVGIGPVLVWQCTHLTLRCVHAEEINKTLRNVWGMDGGQVARVACVDCGDYLYNRPRLEKCTVNGFRHV